MKDQQKIVTKKIYITWENKSKYDKSIGKK